MRGVEQIPWLYDPLLWLSERGGLGRWRRRLVGEARGRVLDLGTGTGRNLPLLGRAARVTGLDPSAPNLGAARRRAPGAPLVRARAEALPFRDGTFDEVISALVLCSVDDPEAALAEVRRVLRPGGALRLLEHVRAGGVRGRLQDALQPAWTAFTGGCRPNRDTEGEVGRAGFLVDAASRAARGVMVRLVAWRP